MKKVVPIILVFICIFCFNCVKANTSTNTINEIIASDTKSKLVEIKDNELKSIDDYKATYGSDIYGVVAYILNKVRIFSIPIAFLGIVISAIYQFIIGARHLENEQKGFNAMIAIVTLLVICQVLPFVFAVVVKGWRG